MLVTLKKGLAPYQQTYIVRQSPIVDPVILANTIRILHSPDRSLKDTVTETQFVDASHRLIHALPSVALLMNAPP